MSGGHAVLVAAAIAATGLVGCNDWESLSARASRCDERCAAASGTCLESGQCVMSCGSGPCRCPDDHSCVINATGTQQQPVEIDCLQAAGCEVRCSTDNACSNATVACGHGDCRIACTADFTCGEFSVACGTGPCEIECTQDGACGGGTVACGDATSCDLECTQQGCSSLKFDCDRAGECGARCVMNGLTCADAELDCGDSPSCDFQCTGMEALCE